MEKAKKSLFISKEENARIEIARIEIENEEIEFLYCNNYGMLEKTNYDFFKYFLKEISFLFITSYNEEITKNYVDFVKYFDKISLPSRKFTYNKPSKEIKF